MAQKRAAGKPEERRREAAASRRTKPVKPADFKKGETSAKRMNQENVADRASRLQTRITPGPRAQWKPGNMIYPVPAVLVTVADCVGGLSRLRSGAGMAAGRIYWLGRFLGTACICGNVISTGGVLYSCVLAASFLGACKGEADTDGWIFNPFIGAGDGNCAGSVAESWFCIITGLTLPILMGLSE